MAEIFLLEDDEMLSRGIEIALKKDGHHITHFFRFREAFSHLEKDRRYDLFLLDINLPDGAEGFPSAGRSGAAARLLSCF